jgi:uncharacterized protein with PIN domain
MPSIICRCGRRLGFGEIPNPDEWLLIADKSFDAISGSVDAETLYRAMTSMLRCSQCGRLWIFWNGFEHEPVAYAVEADTKKIE